VLILGRENSDLLAVMHQLSGIKQPAITLATETRDCEQPISTCSEQCSAMNRFQAFRALAAVEHFVGQSTRATREPIKYSELNVTQLCQSLLWDIHVISNDTDTKQFDENELTTEAQRVILLDNSQSSSACDRVTSSDVSQLRKYCRSVSLQLVALIYVINIKKLEVYIECTDPIITLKKLHKLFWHTFVAISAR